MLQQNKDHPHDRKEIYEDIKAEQGKSMNIGKKSSEKKDSKDSQNSNVE
ncbi:hypothetical protein FOXB_09670 [Fusarium oxysporum f. sp. conglutinans Fo5176]|uniref:Uncharacterized protein n=1 Tax=Fusarium oxysporum (strain Fo5176) TaxID=660025 RepID=F9FTE8_FUSOF|nr:hypothetical protein FOXB_09670 [Fusarium oxysporum f. sp. conglutinans Fo5176]